MIFRGFENFSKNFPKLFFAKNRQRIISFRSHARLSKIEEKFSFLLHGNRFKINNIENFLLKLGNETDEMFSFELQ